MTNVPRARSEEPQGLLAEAEKILGFPPDLLANIVGASYPDDKNPGFNRQTYMIAAQGLLNRYGRIPANLIHAADNKHDPNAIEVHVPTIDNAAGVLSGWKHAGFVATRDCTNPECFHSWGGRAKTLRACPKCGHDAVQPINYLNVFIAEMMKSNGIKEILSTDKSIFSFGVVWISYGSGGKKLGMRLGYKFGDYAEMPLGGGGFMTMRKPTESGDFSTTVHEYGTGEPPQITGEIDEETK